jgi:hypothetical protein
MHKSDGLQIRNWGVLENSALNVSSLRLLPIVRTGQFCSAFRWRPIIWTCALWENDQVLKNHMLCLPSITFGCQLPPFGEVYHYNGYVLAYCALVYALHSDLSVRNDALNCYLNESFSWWLNKTVYNLIFAGKFSEKTPCSVSSYIYIYSF